MTLDSMNVRNPLGLVAALALGVVIPAIFWIAQGATAGLITAGWGWATVLVFHFGRRRSEAVKIVSGTGDERIRSLNVCALAFAGFVMWAVVTAWWLISSATGDENDSVGILAAVFGVAYIGAAVCLGRRGG
jgi:hypothetical protein